MPTSIGMVGQVHIAFLSVKHLKALSQRTLRFSPSCCTKSIAAKGFGIKPAEDDVNTMHPLRPWSRNAYEAKHLWR